MPASYGTGLIAEGSAIFALQGEVARVVVEKITQRAPTQTIAVLTRNVAAYDAYLRGRSAPSVGSGGVRQSIAHFGKAVALDPGFALAWARLAEARIVVFDWGSADSSRELLEQARAALRRAVALAPEHPEVLLARARLATLDRDFAMTRQHLERVEAIQPGMGEVSYLRAFLAVDEKDGPTAVAFGREAITRDPKNGDWANMLAVNVFAPVGDFPTADGLFAQIQGTSKRGLNNRVGLRIRWRGPAAGLKLLEGVPEAQRNAETETLRGLMLLCLGRIEEAKSIAGRVADWARRPDEGDFSPISRTLLLWELTGHTETAQRHALIELERWEEIRKKGNETAQAIEAIASAQLALGRIDAARDLLKGWRPPESDARDNRRTLRIAPAYARVGDLDTALTMLQAAMDSGYRHGHWIRFEPAFIGLRDHPRFQAMMKVSEAFANSLPDPTDL